MQIGSIRLCPDNRLTGEIDYHGRTLRLQLRPLISAPGPSHEIFVDGISTTPPSFGYSEGQGRQLLGRLSIDKGSATLYLAFEPTPDGGYRIHWTRPRVAKHMTRRAVPVS